MNPSIHIIGAGAAGSSIAWGLKVAGRPLAGITDTDASQAQALSDKINVPWGDRLTSDIKSAEIIIVAVSDPMIEVVAEAATAENLPVSGQVWLHLSGALPPEALAPVRTLGSAVGAFHPAHVFPVGRITPITPGTVFGSDGDPRAMDAAERLAADLGGRTVRISGTLRPLYHAATVLASNAVVALVATARDALQRAGVDKRAAESLLVTLARSAMDNSANLGIDRALTGPIQRGDVTTVARHLDALEKNPRAAETYRTLGRAIVTLAKEQGTTDIAALAVIEQMVR